MRKAVSLLMMCVVCARAGADNHDMEYLGDSCMEQFDVLGALNCYERARMEHNSDGLQMKIADCYYLRGDYRRCLGMLGAIAEDTLLHKAFREKFYCYKHLALSEEQIDCGTALVKRYPYDGEIVAELGKTYNAKGLSEKALMLTSQYNMRDSSNVFVKRELANSYFMCRNWEGARGVYVKLIGDGDGTFEDYYSLAMCLSQLKKQAEAYENYKKAVELSARKNVGVLYRYGILCIEIGFADEGIGALNEVISMLSQEKGMLFGVYRVLGETDAKRGNYKLAARQWEEAVKYELDNMTIYYNLGQVYGALGDTGRQKTSYEKFLQSAKEEPQPSSVLRRMIANAEAVLKK